MSTTMERAGAAGATDTGGRIRLTTNDLKRLEALLWSMRRTTVGNRGLVYRLERGISDAVIVPPERLPQDVVSIDSRVRFRDETNGGTYEYSLVFPAEASVFDGKVSVLSPVGSALLGRRVGETVRCKAPGGEGLLRILALVSQPEALGTY